MYTSIKHKVLITPHTTYIHGTFILPSHVFPMFIMRWTESREPFPAPPLVPLAPASSQGGSLSISQRRCRKRPRECCGRWPGASAWSSSCSCTFRSPCLGCPRHLCCCCSSGRWPVSCPRGRWRRPRRAVCSGAPRSCSSLAWLMAVVVDRDRGDHRLIAAGLPDI